MSDTGNHDAMLGLAILAVAFVCVSIFAGLAHTKSGERYAYVGSLVIIPAYGESDGAAR